MPSSASLHDYKGETPISLNKTLSQVCTSTSINEYIRLGQKFENVYTLHATVGVLISLDRRGEIHVLPIDETIDTCKLTLLYSSWCIALGAVHFLCFKLLKQTYSFKKYYI